MDLGIAGRVALVTAASKGLGRSSALALAREGVKVSICARGENALRATEDELAGHTDVLATVADVTDAEAPAALVEATSSASAASTSWWATPAGHLRGGPSPSATPPSRPP